MEDRMESLIESGTELIARLRSRPNLYGLEDTLFLEGPRYADIMEIVGKRSTGKTLLLTQMLAKCILPFYYEAIRIEGCNAAAILINTDHHFQTSKLIELMSHVVDSASAILSTSIARKVQLDKRTVIQKSLRNLHIIDCYDSEQLSLTLHTLDEILIDNAEVGLLAIDSITSYYWQDKEDDITTVDTYVSQLLKLIKMHTTTFNVVTIYTRPYEGYNGKWCVNPIANNLSYKVELCRMRDSSNLLCTLKTMQIVKQIHYSISSSGIKWKTNEGQG